MTTATATSVTRSRPADTASTTPDAAIVIATIAPPLGETGVQTHCRDLHAGLNGAGHSCLLHTPLTASRRWAPVFAVRPLLLKRLNKTWATWWMRHWHEASLRGGLMRGLREREVAAVVAQCPVSARAAMRVRSRLGATFPIVMVCHFNYSEATEYRDRGELASRRFFESVVAMEKQVLESVDRVIYVSRWAQRIVEDDRGIHPRASSVIWNGVAHPVPASKLKRGDLGLGPQDLVLISVGTLEPRKNQLALVKLFAKITVEYPSARLVLVGDGPAREQIESRVAALGLQSKVRLLGFRRDVSDLLPLADIYVHASLLENCPIVLLEAARAGLPVAAVPAGGVPELLEALGGTALDLEDPTPLRPLLGSAELRADAGRNAREVFERQFTREAMVAQYVRTLQLTADPGGG